MNLRHGIAAARTAIQHITYLRPLRGGDRDMAFSDAAHRFPDRTRLHRYMHFHFHKLCPERIREHRLYFSQANRGFGEDAFHAMWFTLLREFRPARCLEIGVYRGQTISLWGLIASILNLVCVVHGLSPFSSSGDGVSEYPETIDYWGDVMANCSRYGVTSAVTLKRAYSNSEEGRQYIQSGNWDLVYIDGGHDFDVALSDYRAAKMGLKSGGLLVIDDSSLYTDFKPPRFSFAGHPGPSEVMRSFAQVELQFVGAVGHNNVFRA